MIATYSKCHLFAFFIYLNNPIAFLLRRKIFIKVYLIENK